MARAGAPSNEETCGQCSFRHSCEFTPPARPYRGPTAILARYTSSGNREFVMIAVIQRIYACVWALTVLWCRLSEAGTHAGPWLEACSLARCRVNAESRTSLHSIRFHEDIRKASCEGTVLHVRC